MITFSEYVGVEEGIEEKTAPIYLGVDVAGAKNTWVAGLSVSNGGLEVVDRPRKASLETIVDYCEANDVVAAAIDAQLTAAISEENGFRTSDVVLRDMLSDKGGSRNWVAAANGLMAVPVRGRLLADHLSPTTGTLIETHPRASLLFGLGHTKEDIHIALREYKPKSGEKKARIEARKPHVEKLRQLWSERFGIRDMPMCHDGELDALVCATVAYLFHHEPDTLYKLPHRVSGKTGRGPFYVLDHASE